MKLVDEAGEREEIGLFNEKKITKISTFSTEKVEFYIILLITH